MQSLFFSDYIKSNMFIEDLQEKLSEKDVYFDLLLSDINFTNWPTLQISPNNKPSQSSLIEARKDAIQTSKHPLIILDQLNINYIKPLIEWFSWNNLTIINLSTGMWSFWKKISPEIEDLNHTKDFDCYEPIDLENMRNILKKSWMNYLRICYRELPDAIFDVDELWIIDSSMLENLDIISLRSYWFWWNDWTIFTSWSLFSLALQTWELLQWQWKECSFFILQKLNSEWTQEMIESITNSKKLYIYIDHSDTKELKKFIENKLSELNITDISIKFLTPKYENITTIFNEYQDEQCWIDPENLAKVI